MSSSDVTVRIAASIRDVNKAFEQMARSLKVAFRQIGQAITRTRPQLRIIARARRGGSGSLNGDWQTSQCAGWLHDSCQNDVLIDCRCTCHGGPLR